MDERDRLSAEAVQLVGKETTPARLEVLEARWMAIASPSRLDPIVDLDAELETLRKELGTLSTDACAPEISVYWRGLGDELRDLAVGPPRRPASASRRRPVADDGVERLLRAVRRRPRRGRAVSLTRRFRSARSRGERPVRSCMPLVHLVTDVIDGEIDDRVGRELADGERAGAERCDAGDAGMGGGAVGRPQRSCRSGRPQSSRRVGSAAENFMGGFGLVGLSEAVILLERRDVVANLTAELIPLDDQMLGHPWAPCFATADVLARLQSLGGDDDAAAASAARAVEVYDRLGATSFRRRLESALS